MPSTVAALLRSDACGQAAALADGVVSSEQLTVALLDAIDVLNPKLNCYLFVDRDAALQAARDSDCRRAEGRALSPVDGLTVAVKDNIDVAGMPTTAGLGMVLHQPDQDAPVVAQLRAAGAVILGKLNMHEAALGTTNDNPHHGRCHNPYRQGIVPGGSSGGSGSAIAAGLCALALGTDTMGSVRIPAACCGVVGLKPSTGRLSIEGTVICCRRLDNIGPLVRSAQDLDLWMPIMSGYTPVSVWSRPYPDYRPEQHSLVNTRLRVVSDLDRLIELSGEVTAMYAEAKETVIAAGARLEQVSGGQVDLGAARRAGLVLVEADLAVAHQTLYEQRSPALSPSLLRMLDWISARDAMTLAGADWQVDLAARWLQSLLSDADVLMLPTVPVAAFGFDQPVPAGHADLTAVVNMAGLPAISLPVGMTADGLPLALQLVGSMGSEAKLVGLSQSLSAILPPVSQPSLYAGMGDACVDIV